MPCLLFAFVFLFPTNKTDYKNKYGLDVIADTQEYQYHILHNPQMRMEEVVQYIPNIVLDIRYATKNNFTNEILYKIPRAFVAKALIDSLKVIQKEFNKKGLGIKIYDAYRPYKVSLLLYQKYKNPTFVSPPQKGSRHNRGCAVDITLINLKTKKEVEMPTKYDSFTRSARYNIAIKNKVAEKNRDYLISIMQKHGFKVTPSEWWHFDFKGFKNYPILDIAFEAL